MHKVYKQQDKKLVKIYFNCEISHGENNYSKNK